MRTFAATLAKWNEISHNEILGPWEGDNYLVNLSFHSLRDLTVSIIENSLILAFISVFIMELADKTQIASFTLTVRYKSRKKVIIGVISGLIAVTIIGVSLGIILKQSFDFNLLKPIIVLLFCGGGGWILLSYFKKEKDKDTEEVELCPVSLGKCAKSIEERQNCKNLNECHIYINEITARNAVIKSFIFIFLAEIGDKTMLTAMTLSTIPDSNPLGVFLGSSLALVIVNLSGIYFGEQITKFKISEYLDLICGILFVTIGIVIGFF